MKNSVKFLVLLTLVLGCVAIASAQSTSNTTQPKVSPTPDKGKLERTTKFDGNVEFPDVEGWELSDKHKYPTDALGYSVNMSPPPVGESPSTFTTAAGRTFRILSPELSPKKWIVPRAILKLRSMQVRMKVQNSSSRNRSRSAARTEI